MISKLVAEGSIFYIRKISGTKMSLWISMIYEYLFLCPVKLTNLKRCISVPRIWKLMALEIFDSLQGLDVYTGISQHTEVHLYVLLL